MTKNVNHVSHKKSKVKNNGKPQLPLASALTEGEIAINYAENVETLSIKNESGNVVTFSSDDYYSEQKLGSMFIGANSAKTVTQAITLLDENKLEISSFSSHTADTTVHLTSTDKANIESLTTNIASISAISSSDVTNWNTAYSNSHSHSNKSVLDDITSTKTSNWDTAYGNSHTHSNMSALNDITAESVAILTGLTGNVGSMAYEDKTSYSSATEVSGAINSHATNTALHFSGSEKANLDSLATNIAAISGVTSTKVNNWDGAATNSHTHSNKSVLDSITSEKVSGWDSASTNSHTHSNKTYLDSVSGTIGTMAYENASSYSSATQVNTALTGKADNASFTAHTADTTVHLTSTEKTNIDSLATNIATISGISSNNVNSWNSAVTSSHTHANKSALDAITGNVGTMAYESTSSYSSATQVNTALSSKLDYSMFVISRVTVNGNISSSCSITGSSNSGRNETIIYNNSSTTTDRTVTIPTTYKTPDGAAIELTCPAGGYCEVNYLNIDGTIYARGL